MSKVTDHSKSAYVFATEAENTERFPQLCAIKQSDPELNSVTRRA